MNNFKEISRREQKTIFTLVEYTFEDGTTKEVEVAHFCPKDEDEILLGINNRYISEAKALGLEE